MKKLLALSIALLSLNLYGAEKTPNEIRLEAEIAKLKNDISSLALRQPKYATLAQSISKHGLEGWGKKDGVKIVVEDYSKFDKTFDVKAIKNQVELKLRLAGIKISEEPTFDWLVISMIPLKVGGRVDGYHIGVTVVRRVTFK